MKARQFVVLLIAAFSSTTSTQAVTISTVAIGNPGNPADVRYVDSDHPNGVGSVAYSFRIGNAEITNSQYVDFLNHVAATDTYDLYAATQMPVITLGGIVRSGSSGNFKYAVKPPVVIPSGPLSGMTYTYDDKPVVFVTWGDAARFTNWLHNGQPTGPQGSGTTEDGAYTLNGAISAAALAGVTRNPGARWWLPSEDEWYKAAYHKNDGVTGNYWDYPTGTNTFPDNNLPSSDTGNSANFYNGGRYAMGNSSYPLTDVGAYTLSTSPYGTFDQGGNVWEWNEELRDGSFRGIRGGAWDFAYHGLVASAFSGGGPSSESGRLGFRVATIPEPATACLGVLGIILILHRGRARS